MGKRNDEAGNLQMLLASAQEKDVRLGLELANSVDVSLPDLTRLTAIALLHRSNEFRTSGMEALQTQTSSEEFAFIRKNWDATYLQGKPAVLFDALARIGESDRIEIDELMRLAVRMQNVFPKDRVRKYPEAFRAFCESSVTNGIELNLLQKPLGLLPAKFTDWDVVKDLEMLNLSKCRLQQLPPHFGSLKNLKLLNVSDNKLRRLPASIEGLEALETLNIVNNLFVEFPAGIAKLPRLQNLEVNLDSGIDYRAIGECKHLKNLNVPASKHPDPFSFLANLPALDDFKFTMAKDSPVIPIPNSLPKWKKLRYANLSLLPEQPFPEFITQMPELCNLEIVFTNEFPIHCIPVAQPNMHEIFLNHATWTHWPDTWSNFPNLSSLRLSNTHMTEVPDFLANCADFTQLHLGHSPIKSLPPFLFKLKKLRQLVLSHTEIEVIPEAIFELKNLTFLSINACPVRKLPESLKKMTWLEQITLTNIKLNKPDVLELIAALPNTLVKW
jgi:Leucine-rich repeat (LRR) protein